MARAPVLLVGDIDRGGVFAQLIGTVNLLEPAEKDMVKGLVINKFRGDKTILDPGITMLEDLSGIPVVGVTPYLKIQVDDEDSLTERFDTPRQAALIDIVVIRLPRISNFTDFNPFEMIEGVSLRYVDHVGDLGEPDMIILPGTKNTMDDLLWMRQNGLEAAVCKKAAQGCVIFGICGGYQMLGERLKDPMGVEAGGEIRGMGLLPMETVFAGDKTRTRVCGVFENVTGALSPLQGKKLEGYEIHMGKTAFASDTGSMTRLHGHSGDRTEDKPDGACSGNIYGTYVHGVFDREQVAAAIVTALGERKGLDMSNISAVDMQAFKETQYDLLAESMRAHMDMEAVYRILEKGI